MKIPIYAPVRALKLYLQRTDTVRKSQQKLFISHRTGHVKDICMGIISGWLKKTVLACYLLSTEQTQQLFKVKAHDIRAFSTSWAYLKNTSMEQILMAGQWKAHTTFTNFYLKDLTMLRDKMLQLGPLVVASTIV